MHLPITQLTPPADRIELGIGQPDPALLPGNLFQQCNVDPLNLAYGAEAGDGRFREALAAWLSHHYSTAVPAQSLMVTNGSSNALDMLCTLLSQHNKTVLVEDPTYFIARRRLADHGFTITAVPMDKEGVNLEALERTIQKHRPAFFYSIPTFHNPTGITQTPERRRALVELSKRYDCPVVADEVYQLLHFGPAPPPPLASYDTHAPIYSIGSFSKILAPGLRLGWIQAAAEPLQRLLDSALLASGGGLAPVTSALVRPLLENGQLDTVLGNLRHTYQARHNTLVSELQEQLGDRLEFTQPNGGFFIWAGISDVKDTATFLTTAHKKGVGYLPGNLFSDSPEQAAYLRLCFAFYDEKDLQEAAKRLREALI